MSCLCINNNNNNNKFVLSCPLDSVFSIHGSGLEQIKLQATTLI
jgi:hypothetical protein